MASPNECKPSLSAFADEAKQKVEQLSYVGIFAQVTAEVNEIPGGHRLVVTIHGGVDIDVDSSVGSVLDSWRKIEKDAGLGELPFRSINVRVVRADEEMSMKKKMADVRDMKEKEANGAGQHPVGGQKEEEKKKTMGDYFGAKEAAPQKAAPQKAAPKKVTPKPTGARKKGARKKGAPQKAPPPKESFFDPKSAPPKAGASKKVVPLASSLLANTGSPQKAAPRKATPKKAAPRKAAPKSSAPKKGAKMKQSTLHFATGSKRKSDEISSDDEFINDLSSDEDSFHEDELEPKNTKRSRLTVYDFKGDEEYDPLVDGEL